jgi:hypothetical protein
MIKNITKVNTCQEKTRGTSEAKPVGWGLVLRDIKADIKRLKKDAVIVERKIKRGEPWPGQEIAGTEAESIPA